MAKLNCSYSTNGRCSQQCLLLRFLKNSLIRNPEKPNENSYKHLFRFSLLFSSFLLFLIFKHYLDGWKLQKEMFPFICSNVNHIFYKFCCIVWWWEFGRNFSRRTCAGFLHYFPFLHVNYGSLILILSFYNETLENLNIGLPIWSFRENWLRMHDRGTASFIIKIFICSP